MGSQTSNLCLNGRLIPIHFDDSRLNLTTLNGYGKQDRNIKKLVGRTRELLAKIGI